MEIFATSPASMGYPQSPQTSSDWMQALYEHGITNIPHSLDNLATSLTNHMRLQGQPAEGIVNQDQTFIYLRWEWLILPFAVEVPAIFFVTGTIISTVKSDLPVWKASALAMFFHGPGVTDPSYDALPR